MGKKNIPIGEFSKFRAKHDITNKYNELVMAKIKEQVLRRILKENPTPGLKKLHEETLNKIKKLMD